MPRGSIMLQFEVTQYLADRVSQAPGFRADIFEFLDGDNLTVREITAEKWGGILASNAPGAVPMLAITPFTRLILVFADPKKERVVFYGPTYVPSPKVQGAGLVILRVTDVGMTADAPVFSLSRTIGAHAYVDETA